MERILTKNRVMEYLTIDGLKKMTGVGDGDFDIYVLKELIDNSMDACESKGVPPTIKINIKTSSDYLTITVSDKGPGMSAEMLDEIANFERFGGTKHFVKKPTRGAQGNALMTILGINQLLVAEKGIDNIPVEFIARNERRRVSLKVDNILEKVHIQNKKSPARGDWGTTVKITLPNVHNTWGGQIRYDEIIEEFALWNPHVKIEYIFNETRSYFPRTSKTANRYLQEGFGSIHWYTLDDFEGLLHANIRYLEERKKRESIVNFTKHFKGCSSNRKESTNIFLSDGLPKYINSVQDQTNSEKLFHYIKSMTKPPKSSVLGEIGKDHFYNIINRYKIVRDKVDGDKFKDKFQYKKIKGVWGDTDIPFVLELAIGATEKLEGRKIVFGINNTITYCSPFEQDLFYPTNVNERDKPFGKVVGVAELLRYYEIHRDDPVMIAIHLICPNIRYKDYGKSEFNTNDQNDQKRKNRSF